MAKGQEPHDVRFDRAGYGYPRLTCWSCPSDADITCLYKAYMTEAEWRAVVEEFRKQHPFDNLVVPVR